MEFTSDQTNMEGAANAAFTYNATLRNRTAEQQVYALRAQTPPGWNISFRANGKQVSSVDIEANRTQDITIEIDPPNEKLTAIAVWLFFTVFYQIIINVVAKAMMPAETANPYEVMSYQKFIMGLLRLVPSQLFSDATTTLLMPSIRSLGPLTMEQMYGAIPSPLPLKESLIIVWPQLTGLIAATALCFALSYYSFMRKEIKSR